MQVAEYRLGELSELSGVSVRNIRAYRERGLLDAPRRDGRAAVYNDRHLSQLRTVNELLRRGFTTAHIAEFLVGTRQGRDLADILGLQQAIFGPPRRGAGQALDIDPDGDEARRLVRHGLAEVADGEVTLVNPNIAEIVGRATDQLPYVQTILRLADGTADLVDDLAAAVVQAARDDSFTPGGVKLGGAYVDGVELDGVAIDYRALGHEVVAGQLVDALQRRLVAAESDYAAGSLLGKA